MEKDAELSSCRKYRYALWRTWDEDKMKVMFIGLNPSTANEFKDDPTVTRCISYAKQWGYGGIIMGNIFAYRTSSTDEMKRAEDPIGRENDAWLNRLSEQADIIVAMWGNLGDFRNRSAEVCDMFPDLMCFSINATDQPHHTRGLPDGITPIPYSC